MKKLDQNRSRPCLSAPIAGLLILCFAFAATAYGDRTMVGTPRVMEGPMVGAVTSSEIRIWTRMSGPYAFSVRYADNPLFENANESAPVSASAETDFTAVTIIEGLTPGQAIWYVALIDGKQPKYEKNKQPYQTHTAPEGDTPFTVAFGSCARIMEDPAQTIWGEITNAKPDLFLWLGDNIYADTLYPQFIAEEYRKQRSVLGLQPLLRSTPNLSTWDDHDFGLNDSDRDNPIKNEALQLFKNYWANPSYGEPGNPGVYFEYSYGGVDFFFTDNRFYRAPYFDKDDENKTMLGKRQMQWLKSALKNSTAPFKVLINGGGWNSQKGPDGDSWASFLTERDELFSWITSENIGGIILLSGDTHRAELQCIPWSEKGGYDFYELVSSPLSQNARAHPPLDTWEMQVNWPYSGGTNFGMLYFDTTQSDPILSYTLINEFGQEEMGPFKLRASQLQTGVSTWRSKVRSEEAERHDRSLQRNTNP